MVADDGARADGVAHEDADEDEVHVHDDPEGRHAVLPDEAHELEVIEDADQGGGEVPHHLRGAVGAGLGQDPALQSGFRQAERGLVGQEEVDQGHHAPHQGAGHRGDGRPGHAPGQDPHQKPVPHHVGQARRHREPQPQLGPLRRHEEALEHILQNKGHQGQGENAPVADGQGKHFSCGPQKEAEGLHDELRQNRQHRAGEDAGGDDEGEVAVCPGQVPLSHGAGHHGAAAGAQHEAHRGENHQGGHNEVHRREGGLARVVGNEHAVYHAVDGGEDQHDHGGEGKAQEFAVSKMFG